MISMPGFEPTRSAKPDGNGWIVTVQPPPQLGIDAVTIRLDGAQYRRYEQWLAGKVLIQDALPELTPAEREMLLTGLNDDEWHKAVDVDEDEEDSDEAFVAEALQQIAAASGKDLEDMVEAFDLPPRKCETDDEVRSRLRHFIAGMPDT